METIFPKSEADDFNKQRIMDRADRWWPTVWRTVEREYMASRKGYQTGAYEFPSMRVKVPFPKAHASRPAYPFCFEISSRPRSTRPSELDRVIAGEGDWYFYGFPNAADPPPEFIDAFDFWHLIDLAEFRRLWKAGDIERHLRVYKTFNQNVSVDLIRCPRSLIVASSCPELDPNVISLSSGV